jgi:hypothetical protein
MWFEPEVGEKLALFQQLIEYLTVPENDGIAMIYCRRCGYHASSTIPDTDTFAHVMGPIWDTLLKPLRVRHENERIIVGYPKPRHVPEGALRHRWISILIAALIVPSCPI